MLRAEVQVVNVGLPLFADAVREQGRPVEQVDWRIPAGGDLAVVAALTRLYGPASDRVEAANAEVLRRLDGAKPLLTDVLPVRDVVPDAGERTLLHCGPAIGWADVCDPLRRSMRAAVVAEGWADGLDEADRLLGSGGVALEPANEHGMVVPMASALGVGTGVRGGGRGQRDYDARGRRSSRRSRSAAQSPAWASSPRRTGTDSCTTPRSTRRAARRRPRRELYPGQRALRSLLRLPELVRRARLYALRVKAKTVGEAVCSALASPLFRGASNTSPLSAHLKKRQS